MKKTVKKIILLLVTAAFAAALFSLLAFADGTLTGKVGNAEWTLTQNSDGKTYALTVTGSGKLGKIDAIADYKGSVTSVRVGGDVNAIGWGAFQSYSALTTVELSEKVTAIEGGAFEYDTKLATIFVTGHEKKVGTYDLSYVNSLGSWCFDNCKAVSNIIFCKTSQYSLPLEFLKNNSNLETLYIPANVTLVKKGAFKMLYALKSITFEGDTTVEDAFIEPVSGQTLRIYAEPDSPAYVYAGNTDGITPFPAGADFSEDALIGGRYEDESVYWELVPNGTDTYMLHIFGTGSTYGRTLAANTETGTNEDILTPYINKITYIKIGGSVSAVASGSFRYYSNVETLEISENVNSFGLAAFAVCRNLKTIFVTGNEPVTGTYDLSNVTSFGGYLFDGCRYVEKIIFNITENFSLPVEFLKNNQVLTELYIPKNIYRINAAAFSRCTALKNVYIEDDTVLTEDEKEAKGAYPFVTSEGKPATMNLSAKSGTSACEYAARHSEVTYVAPQVKTLVFPDGTSTDFELVKGFYAPNYYRTENDIYIVFSDETCTKLVREVGGADMGDVLYGKKLFETLGYMVRVKDYNGLRAFYKFDTTLLDSIDNYEIVEIGTLGEAFVGARPHLSLDRSGASKNVIYEYGTLVGKLVYAPDTNGMATFASTATGFEKDGSPAKNRVATEIMFCAYAVIRNAETGEDEVIYTDVGVRSLSDACEKTLESSEAQTLTESEKNFIRNVTSLGVDSDAVPTKAEVKALIEDAYNSDYILSGQHMGNTGADSIDACLESIYKNSGRYPAVLAFDAGTQYRASETFGDKEKSIVSDLTTFAKHGGTVSISAHFTNPDPDYLGNDVRGSVGSTARWDELFTAGTEINKNFMKQLEFTADILEAFETNGVTVLWRPYHETNGAWFWFCGATMYKTFYREMKAANPSWSETKLNTEAYAKALKYYNKLYDFTYDYMMTERGLTNLIWVISPNIAPDGKNTPTFSVDKFIPASDKYEIAGIDWYMGGTLENPAEEMLQSDYKNVYPTMKNTGKPVVLTEWGPGSGLRGSSKETTYNGAQVLDLIERMQKKGISFGYILFWSSWSENLISLYEMGNMDIFMQSETVIDLAEAYELVQNMK